MSGLSSTIAPPSFSFRSQLFHQNVYTTSNSIIRCCDDTARLNIKPHEDNGSASFPEKNLLLNPAAFKKPPRPRRIILVRHGQSEGNVDEAVYTRVADPKVGLTEQGVAEAEERGRKIRKMIEEDGAEDWKVYFYVSPYRRGLETLRNLAKAFERSRIAGVREEPRLREQDFGTRQIVHYDARLFNTSISTPSLFFPSSILPLFDT